MAWILKQYDETERTAQEAAADDVARWELENRQVVGDDPRYDSMIVERSDSPSPWQRAHIARNDPFTVLADVHAKRAIIDTLATDTSPEGQQRQAVVIRLLAGAMTHRRAPTHDLRDR